MCDSGDLTDSEHHSKKGVDCAFIQDFSEFFWGPAKILVAATPKLAFKKIGSLIRLNIIIYILFKQF